MALTSVEEAQLRDLIAQQSALLSLASSEATIISKLGATKKNIGNLTAASSFDDTDLLVVRQGTTDKSIAGSVVKSAIGSPDATESIKGIAEIATQAETNAGVDSSRIVTPLKLRFGFAANLTNTGYISFPTWMGGLIIQWGSTSSFADDSSSTVTFPTAFPTNCFIVNATPTANVGGGSAFFAITAKSLINFTAWYSSTPTAVANTAYWVAIGN